MIINKIIKRIEHADEDWRLKARKHLENLTMPRWALGRLMDLAVDLAGITRSLEPPVERKAVVTMAADHGVAAGGVSAFPQVVTQQMVHNFVAGGAGINALAGCVGARVQVVDMGVAGDLSSLGDSIISRKIAFGTQDMAKGPAMTSSQAVRAVEAGMEIAYEMGKEVDVFGTGEMGIGNTTPSSAIVSVLTGDPVEDVTGRGTGIDDERLQLKIDVIRTAIRVNRPDPDDGLDVLAKVGGFEIGGLAGLIIGAAAQNKPVLIDGFISTAAALIACKIAPESRDYMIAAHRSVEQGHRHMQEFLGKEPMLDLDLRLGEGTGAALAMNLVAAAASLLTEVATFDQLENHE